MSLSRLCGLGVLSGLSVLGYAQTAQLPDAGRILQEVLTAPIAPLSAPAELRLEAQALSDITPGGAEVEVLSIQFAGHTQFTEQELLAVFAADVFGRSYDLGGLRALANQISTFYRDSGYAFARAFIPAQDLEAGRLLIQVVEGRYGNIEIDADSDRTAAQVARFLSALEPGQVIDQPELERLLALLGDVPGTDLLFTIVAGSEPGTGDVLVRVEEQRVWSGRLMFDNHGNRFSGAYRGLVNLQLPKMFAFGDQFEFSTLYSSEALQLASLQYSLPLENPGLRANFAYNVTRYDLGQGADAQGNAQVSTVGLSYPVVRRTGENLNVSLSYQYKLLRDTFAVGQARRKTEAHIFPLVARFDRNDPYWGGGVNFGSVTLSLGSTVREENLAGMESVDDISFLKLNLQLVRYQNLPMMPVPSTLVTSLSAQLSDTTLDSSETFSLGGANAVRAYPQGEGSGSQGYVGQVELRTVMPPVEPYTFIDVGFIPERAAGVEIQRTLVGTGVGLRGEYLGVSGDLSLAWRLTRSQPTSDTQTRGSNPRLWFSLAYGF